MRLTVVPSDNAVYKDGECRMPLLWDGTPADVHALQWYDVSGWIEYKDHIYPNETIYELPQWALNAEAAWEAAGNVPAQSTMGETANVQNNPPPEALIDATQVVY